MMMQLQIGATVIPYAIRESARARAMKIVVTPSTVQVVVPIGTAMDGSQGVTAYLERKRRWLFDAVRTLKAQHQALLDQQYASGAKLQYRGRWLMLEVRPGEVAAVQIACRSKFHIVVPGGLEGTLRLEAVRAACDSWLRQRAFEAVQSHVRQHAANLRVQPAGFRVSQARSRWGSCGRDGVLRIHWQLIQAPAAALEYVVAHEVAHLLHRHHGPEFWQTLARTLPDWAERKAMLERWEGQRRAV